MGGRGQAEEGQRGEGGEEEEGIRVGQSSLLAARPLSLYVYRYLGEFLMLLKVKSEA